MLYLALELIRLLCSDCLRVEECVSSRFGGAGDKHRGGASPYLGRRVEAWDHGYAMRGPIPRLGQVVTVCNLRNNKCAAGPILDRGPYGVTYPSGAKPHDNCKRKGDTWWCIGKADDDDEGRHRGCVDVAIWTALHLLDHDGWERVRVYSWR